jgi:WD40 repeat protein
LRLIDAIDTCLNTEGLCALSSDPAISVLATPDKNKGQVKVTLYEKNDSKIIAAHTNSVSYMALNFSGSLLATASDKGTLIRLFSTENGQPVQEVRRGSDKAKIHCISFDRASSMIACSSDKGTIHIFNVASTTSKIQLSDENAPGEEDHKKDGGEVRNRRHM